MFIKLFIYDLLQTNLIVNLIVFSDEKTISKSQMHSNCYYVVSAYQNINIQSDSI
jgi:hypothetical protein